jgi:hypothetical protein
VVAALQQRRHGGRTMAAMPVGEAHRADGLLPSA